MAASSSVSVSKTVALLRDPAAGVGAAASQLASDRSSQVPAIAPEQILAQNVSFEIAERSSMTKYPAVHVYADRVKNALTEKFRTFSGKVRTVAEVRVSQDRIEGIEDQLKVYAEAVTQVLDANRGDWGQGAFYTGGYEVQFDPVKHGGRNFLQVARVLFEVDLSK